MNAFATPFRQLVERRLWPLAVLLLAAVVAVPVLLSKSPQAPIPTGPVASAAAEGTAATQPIVSLADPAQREQNRRVLGKPKNPFRPAVKAKPLATATPSASHASAATAPSSSSGSSSGGASAGGGAGVVIAPSGSVTPTVPGATITPVKKTYEMYSLMVRFGPAGGDAPAAQNLKRLAALPDETAPALIYLGLLSDHKTAVFLVDAQAKAQGDGRCLPSPSNCQTVRMHAGDTEFIDGSDGTQYQLDLKKIITHRTVDATKAAAARMAVAHGGRDALRARLSRVGALVYDARTGTLRKAH